MFVENKKLAQDGDFLEPLLAVSDQEQRLMPDVEQSVHIDLESQTWIKEDSVPLVATETHSSTFFFCLRYIFLSVFLCICTLSLDMTFPLQTNQDVQMVGSSHNCKVLNLVFILNLPEPD